jgi:hypothetical protein
LEYLENVGPLDDNEPINEQVHVEFNFLYSWKIAAVT